MILVCEWKEFRNNYGDVWICYQTFRMRPDGRWRLMFNKYKQVMTKWGPCPVPDYNDLYDSEGI